MSKLLNITINDAFLDAVSRYPNNDAITYCDEVLTYEQLNKKVICFANYLSGLGVNKGTHVGIWCDTTPNALIGMLAVVRLGGVVVMLNTSLHGAEMYALLEKTDTTILLYGDGFKDVDYKEELKPYESSLKTCYIGDTLPGNVDSVITCEIKPTDDAFILFTSGTTSSPRAVVTTHYSRANSGLEQGRDIETTSSDRFCLTMPIFHCFCMSANIFAALFNGACLCIPKSHHTKDVLKTIEKEHCTVLSSVPTFYHALITKNDLSQYDLSSLRVGLIGGSFCTPELFKEIDRALDFTLISSIGQTEATAGITVASLTDSLDERASTIGHFMNHIEYKFAENGEICVKGYVVMKEYYGDAIGTSNAIDEDGFLHTGDAGYLNENGNVVLTGRIKEFIIRAGENISPLEIEGVLAADNRVDEVKAIGVPDSHYGEEVALCVIKKSPISEEEIREIYRKSLAEYKNPKYIIFMDEFPKTSSGKIKALELKKQVNNLLSI